jgi:hypothetical protein
MARKNEFWIPYADDINSNVTVWKEETGHIFKAINKESFPSILWKYTFPHGLDHETYKIISQVREDGYLKVSRDLGVFWYKLDLVEKIEHVGASYFMGVDGGPLFILNLDGTCGLIACCLADVFEEAII